MGKGKGTIVPLEDKPNNKCRKWQLRVSAGLNPRTGKYRTRTHRVNGTYSEAQKALRSFVDEVEHEEHIGRENITLNVLLRCIWSSVRSKSRNQRLSRTPII